MTPLAPITALPGRTWLDSAGRGPSRVRVRGVSFGPTTAHNPAFRSWLLIAHRRGATTMSRRIGGAQETAEIRPDLVSLHPGATPATWSWADPIDVLHVHLDAELLDRAARQVLDAPLAAVRLRHGLGLRDAALLDLALGLEDEARAERPGAALAMEGLAAQMAVRLLRDYGEVAPAGEPHGLDPEQRERVRALVLARLDTALSVEDMAEVAGLRRTGFGARFAVSFGATPHQFLMRVRLERAGGLLAESPGSIAEIAAATGFSDQSHLTREFRRRYGVTPAAYRRGR